MHLFFFGYNTYAPYKTSLKICSIYLHQFIIRFIKYILNFQVFGVSSATLTIFWMQVRKGGAPWNPLGL